MVIVSQLPLSDSPYSRALLTDFSRTKSMEGSSPPRGAQCALYHQDLYDPRAEAACLPRTESQWHDPRHRGS